MWWWIGGGIFFLGLIVSWIYYFVWDFRTYRDWYGQKFEFILNGRKKIKEITRLGDGCKVAINSDLCDDIWNNWELRKITDKKGIVNWGRPIEVVFVDQKKKRRRRLCVVAYDELNDRGMGLFDLFVREGSFFRRVYEILEDNEKAVIIQEALENDAAMVEVAI